MLISQQNHSNVVNEEKHNLNFSSENHNHWLPRQQTCRQSATKTWQKRLRRKFYGFQNWWTILKLPIYPPTFLALPLSGRLLKRRYISAGLDLGYVLPTRTRIEDAELTVRMCVSRVGLWPVTALHHGAVSPPGAETTAQWSNDHSRSFAVTGEGPYNSPLSLLESIKTLL